MSQMASGLCRFIAAAGRNMITASTYGAFAFLALFALGGFVLSRGIYIGLVYRFMKQNHFLFSISLRSTLHSLISTDDIKKWWIWGYWISPMMYGQNAVVANEFLGRSWRHVTFYNHCFAHKLYVSSVSQLLPYFLIVFLILHKIRFHQTQQNL